MDEKNELTEKRTRPDTLLPQLRAGGQGLYWRSLHHLGRTLRPKTAKTKKKKSVTD